MALVYLVRHAQASFGQLNYDQLSELGQRQAHWLGEWFAEQGIAFRRVMSGTLERQRATARAIVGAASGDPESVLTHAGLDEYQGDAIWSAHTQGADQIAHQRADHRAYWRTFREAMQAWCDDRLLGVPETWPEFGVRVRQALDEVCEGTVRDDNLLVVSSGGAIGRAITDIVGGPPTAAIELNLQFRNTGFCELIAGRGTLRMLSYNNIPHLLRPDRHDAITFA